MSKSITPTNSTDPETGEKVASKFALNDDKITQPAVAEPKHATDNGKAPIKAELHKDQVPVEHDPKENTAMSPVVPKKIAPVVPEQPKPVAAHNAEPKDDVKKADKLEADHGVKAAGKPELNHDNKATEKSVPKHDEHKAVGALNEEPKHTDAKAADHSLGAKQNDSHKPAEKVEPHNGAKKDLKAEPKPEDLKPADNKALNAVNHDDQHKDAAAGKKK